MGSVLVIVLPPSTDDLPGMTVTGKQMLIETLVPEPAVEALDEAILHRLARRDVVPLDAALLLPFEHRVAGQLRSVIADHHARITAMLRNGVQLAGNTLGSSAAHHLCRQGSHAHPLQSHGRRRCGRQRGSRLPISVR